jgi:menaquinone reductase, molybdopterin-binding-like subunit
MDDANPVFATPPAWRVREAIERVPFIASFGSFIDETSVWADLILPDRSFLESWIDSSPESGAPQPVNRVAPPVMRALHDTRSTPDVLLDLARRLRRPLDPPLPWQTFEEMLHAEPGMAGDEARDANDHAGSSHPAAHPADGARAPVAFTPPRFDGDPAEYPFLFLPCASHALLDGSLAHLPWLQELPDPLSTAMWSSWVEINPHTASRLGIGRGDLVDVTSRHGSLRAPALLTPAIAPDAVAMPVGQGHKTFTRYASGRGANPIALLGPMSEPETGSLAWAATRVKVARAGPGDGSLILFAGDTKEREEVGR